MTLVLKKVDPRQLEFRGRTRARAPLLVGIVLDAMAVLPWLMSGHVFPWRALASVALAVCGTLVIRACLPRTVRLVIDVEQGVFRRDGRTLPLSRIEGVRLKTTGPVEDDWPVLRYRAELVLDDGTHEPLLERLEPAGVIHDLRRILGLLALPVQPGWGLPVGTAPWKEPRSREARPSRPSPARIDVRAPRFEAQRAAAITVLGSGVFTCAAMTVMLLSEHRRGGHIAPLSLGLAVSAALLVLLIGLALATEHVRIRSNHEMCIEQNVFGLAWRRFKLPRSDLRGVYPVGPDSSSPRHVLFDLQGMPIAVRCASESAEYLHRLFQPSGDG